MAPNAQDPRIAVVVVAGARPLRLRWLLNALEDQAGETGRIEVVVAVPSGVTRTAADAHPLVVDGVARVIEAPAGGAAAARNAGWREARAPVVAFADEDTRPADDWIERALAHTAARPEAVIAGELRSDPLEGARLHAPLHDTRWAPAGAPFAPLAGSVWPRSLLDALGGLDEAAPDEAAAAVDLVARAAERGQEVVPAPDVVLYDAVRPLAPARTFAEGGLAWAVRRHPALRAALVAGVFRRRSHAALALALGGLVLARRRPVLAALALPWALAAVRGLPPQQIPGRLARRGLREGAEMAALAAGSARHRALVL